MKFTFKIILIILLVQNSFCQEKYHFDTYVISNIKNYYNGYEGKFTQAFSVTDSTYTLEIQEKKLKAILFDNKKNLGYLFNSIPIIKNVKDFKKLNNPYTINNYSNLPNKDTTGIVEDVSIENDTVKKIKIISLIKYKDSLKQEIVREYFYFFNINKEMNFPESIKLKEKFIKKFDLIFKDDENLFKIISSKDNKILVETEFVKFVKEGFDLKFTAKKNN